MADPNRDYCETDADRRTANIILLVGAVVLIAGGIWLVNAMLDARQADECMSSGRRSGKPIAMPGRSCFSPATHVLGLAHELAEKAVGPGTQTRGRALSR